MIKSQAGEEKQDRGQEETGTLGKNMAWGGVGFNSQMRRKSDVVIQEQ